MADQITIFEVGARDGLQNEPTTIPTENKVALINQLSKCGFSKIEATAFVSPKWVPQMADASEVMGQIDREPGVSYAVLTPNLKGFERALDAKVDEVAIFASASEGFSQANINASVEESIERFKPIAEAAKQHHVPVRGYISCVTDCPFDGPTDPGQVADLTQTLMQVGCYEVSLGDTIGKGTPHSIGAMLDAVLKVVDASKLAGHYHDTNSTALDNIKVSLEKGLRTFDASVGGLGGCPYAPGAAGNVATEAVVDLVEGLGFETGLDREKLAKTASYAAGLRSDR